MTYDESQRAAQESIRKGEPGEEVYCKICDLEIGRALVSFGSPGYKIEKRIWVHVHSGLRHCHPVAVPAMDGDRAPGRSWVGRHNTRKLLARKDDHG